MTRAILAILAILALSACCRSEPDTCGPWSPIRPTSADLNVVSETLMDQILAHDRVGQDICGWSP